MHVSFMRPVALRGIGLDGWSRESRQCEGISCYDKGTHMLFCYETSKKKHRVRVPLPNIAYVHESDDDEEKEAKK